MQITHTHKTTETMISYKRKCVPHSRFFSFRSRLYIRQSDINPTSHFIKKEEEIQSSVIIEF